MNEAWVLAWRDIELWRWIVALACGVGVGIVYFGSLKWSIRKMGTCKRRLSLFTSVALCRIILFLGVMVLIANHNVAVVVVYVLSFFITKMIFIAITKKTIEVEMPRSDEK